MFNEIIQNLKPTDDPYFTTVIKTRLHLCNGVFSSGRLYHSLADCVGQNVFDGLPKKGESANLYGLVVQYALAAKEIFGQMAKLKNIDFDQLVENSKAEAQFFFSKCNDDNGVIELANVMLTKSSWGYNFKDNKSIDIEPMAAVINLVQMQCRKMHDPFLSVLDYVISRK